MSDENIVNAAAEAVEEFCSPDKMSKPEAIDFLEDVISRLRSSMEAIQEEMDE